MQAKLSLVFPCYHAAQHMSHVLIDLQSQTFKEFEAILVNDGDNTQVEAMNRIALQDSRIRIIQLKKNSGVAAARNAGTDVVTSPWVVYPDPDDRFGPDYAKSLIEAVDGTNVELACGGYRKYMVESGKEFCFRLTGDADNTVVLEMALGYDLMTASSASSTNWNKLYSVEIIRREGLRQNTILQRRQDIYFNLAYYSYVKKVALVRDCGYVYQWHSNGKSNSSVFVSNILQQELDILLLREQLYHHLKWSKQRIAESRKRELVNIVHFVFKNHLAYNNHMSIHKAAVRLKEDVFDQPEMVDAILNMNLGNDMLMQLEKVLVRLGNPLFATIIYKILVFVRNLIGKKYEKLKCIVRGE